MQVHLYADYEFLHEFDKHFVYIKIAKDLKEAFKKLNANKNTKKERTRDVRVCVFGRFRMPASSPSGLAPSLLALIACKKPWGEQSEIQVMLSRCRGLQPTI